MPDRLVKRARMETESARNKIDAIYELRSAVETKAQAEHKLEQDGSAAARDAFLTAMLDVEAKTQDAIDVCHECGHGHADDEPHRGSERVRGRMENVVEVDFRPADEGESA